jgi:hypothetical protein
MLVDYALAERKINEVNINVMDRKKSSKECSNPTQPGKCLRPSLGSGNGTLAVDSGVVMSTMSPPDGKTLSSQLRMSATKHDITTRTSLMKSIND